MFLAQSCVDGLYHVLTRFSGNGHIGSVNRRDAWAKHKDVESYEAKWLYVDALLKVSLVLISLAELCAYSGSGLAQVL